MQDWLEEFKVYVRARYPILWLITWEEERARRILADLARETKKRLYLWTATEGFREERTETPALVAEPLDFGAAAGAADDRSPLAALDAVAHSSERAVFVLHDFHAWLDDPKVVRRVRDLVATVTKSYKTLVFLSPVLKLPAELEKDVTVIDMPLPGLPELTGQLHRFLENLQRDRCFSIDLDPDLIERVARAALGLTEAQANHVFGKAVVIDRKFSEEDLAVINAEKRQEIRKSGILEFFDQDESLAQVGGLELLKRWFLDRQGAFSERARVYGLPEPKGLLLLGVQGCGKSLSAKAIATSWRLPLLRLDVGRIFGSYIGSSEENMRRALKTAESVAPVVLWLDEIEKGFGGVKSGASADAGASTRVFATFLTWLQEKTRPVFFVATANRIVDLPPELLRKGRFDEIFFIDLPGLAERREVFRIHLARRRRDPARYDLEGLAQAADGCSGAEVEQAIVSAMYFA
ncbi:MAG: AAA family ATPase [Planctomycetes bacterium]|nr:AAA family ATPase [Planctomycetota bacterium]